MVHGEEGLGVRRHPWTAVGPDPLLERHHLGERHRPRGPELRRVAAPDFAERQRAEPVHELHRDPFGKAFTQPLV